MQDYVDFFTAKEIHSIIREGGQAMANCQRKKPYNYHYLAMCVYQLMKWVTGSGDVEAILCMCDSEASFLCVYNSM